MFGLRHITRPPVPTNNLGRNGPGSCLSLFFSRSVGLRVNWERMGRAHVHFIFAEFVLEHEGHTCEIQRKRGGRAPEHQEREEIRQRGGTDA